MDADLLLFITMTGSWVCGPRDTVVMMDSAAAQASTMVSLIFFDASHLYDFSQVEVDVVKWKQKMVDG